MCDYPLWYMDKERSQSVTAELCSDLLYIKQHVSDLNKAIFRQYKNTYIKVTCI